MHTYSCSIKVGPVPIYPTNTTKKFLNRMQFWPKCFWLQFWWPHCSCPQFLLTLHSTQVSKMILSWEKINLTKKIMKWCWYSLHYFRNLNFPALFWKTFNFNFSVLFLKKKYQFWFPALFCKSIWILPHFYEKSI